MVDTLEVIGNWGENIYEESRSPLPDCCCSIRGSNILHGNIGARISSETSNHPKNAGRAAFKTQEKRP
ncbi:MAG: hypothetical protein M3P45_07510, partial [Acidobacteriota bacterium]|nr:hypothetical protein [Acidobacteriota bacterium]